MEQTMTMGMLRQSPWSSGSAAIQHPACRRVSTPPPPALAPTARAPLMMGGLGDPFFPSGATTPPRTADSMIGANPMLLMEYGKKVFYGSSSRASSEAATATGDVALEFYAGAAPGLENFYAGAAPGGERTVDHHLEQWRVSGHTPRALHAAPLAAASQLDFVPPPPPPHPVSRADVPRDLQKALNLALSQSRHQIQTEDEEDAAEKLRPRAPLPEELPLPDVSGNATAGNPPSLGSIGHPHNCGGPCRYVKRQWGCRDGFNCTSCHLCFWHRRSVMARQLIRMGVTPEQEPALEVLTAEGAPLAHANSVGTIGHPHTCGEPCKYVRRRSGCRDGSACTNCHACQWRRKPLATDEEADAEDYEEDYEQDYKQDYMQDYEQKQEEYTAPEGYGAQLGADDLSCWPCNTWVSGLDTATLRSIIPPPPGLDLGDDTPNAPGWSTEPAAECPSIGSIGHPHSCGNACKYVNRAGGCKDGYNCQQCHVCRWQRKVAEPAEAAKAAVETSLGSIGHPHNCTTPCKYVRRKGGCRDGAQCPHCHVCRWSRKHGAGKGDEQDSDGEELAGSNTIDGQVGPEHMLMNSAVYGFSM